MTRESRPQAAPSVALPGNDFYPKGTEHDPMRCATCRSGHDPALRFGDSPRSRVMEPWSAENWDREAVQSLKSGERIDHLMRLQALAASRAASTDATPLTDSSRLSVGADERWSA